MLQIRKIREFTPRGSSVSKKFDAPFEPNITADSIKDLFTNTQKYVDQIPEKERFNVYYTLGHVPEDIEPKQRKWSWQEAIPFDIDGIEVAGETVDPKYFEVIGEALNVDLKKCVTMFSGNGLQILIKPKFEIKDVKWFKHNQKYYQFLCSRINDKLSDAGLAGEADASAFAPNRLFRLPLTLNKKPNKPERIAKLIYASTDPIDYDLKKASGLPDIDEKDHLSEEQLGYFKIDSSAVVDGCDFLKWMKAEPQNVSEPEWYAGLSVLARLDRGREISHEYSKGHPSYYDKETDRKIDQALEASGPRTCDNINKHWGRCKTCPHFKKVPSPISIKGPNFIATENTGFHLMGKKGALLPQYEDLRLFYDKEHTYINASDIHFRYEDTHYKEYHERFVDNYAQVHFNPPADNKKVAEFRGLVKRTHLKDASFFGHTTDRLINLSNGVLNIDTMELSEHDPKYGFKHCLGFSFDPIADAPTFKNHLKGITCGDPTLEANLLEYMGYCLANDKPKAQKMLVLTGSGQNGKSTFLEIIRTLGGAAVTSLGVTELGNSFYRQQLDGALFNIIEEMPNFAEKSFWEDMKGLITGAMVTASKKHKDPYTFVCKTKFVMTCNDLPKGANPNHGYFRRLLIVPFSAKFQGQGDDKDIADRIVKDELPGVLNMVLDAYHRLKANNWEFTQSDSVNAALSAYKLEADNVTRWCEEHLEIGECQGLEGAPSWMVRTNGGRIGANVDLMYKDFKTWCEDEGERAVSRIHFSKRLAWWYAAKTGSETNPIKRVRSGTERARVLDSVRHISDAAY